MGGGAVMGGFQGWGVVAAYRSIVVRVGDVNLEVGAVPVAGTEPMSGRVSKAAGSVADAFGPAHEAIIEVARSTSAVIERVGAAARPDRAEVEYGLKFSASGGVITAGVAGEAALKVTLLYDVAARPATDSPAALHGATAGPPLGWKGRHDGPGGDCG